MPPKFERLPIPISFLRWASLEPRLLDLVLKTHEIAVAARRKRHFCANKVWLGPFGTGGLKAELEKLVGWFAQGEEPQLKTAAAFEVGHNLLYRKILPDCRRCACLDMSAYRGQRVSRPIPKSRTKSKRRSAHV